MLLRKFLSLLILATLVTSIAFSSVHAQDTAAPAYRLNISNSEATSEEVQIYAADVARRAKNVSSGAAFLFRLYVTDSDNLEDWQTEFNQDVTELLALESPRHPDAFFLALTLYLGRADCLSLSGIVFESLANDPGSVEMQVNRCSASMQSAMRDALSLVARTAAELDNYESVQAMVDEDNSPEARRDVFSDAFGDGIWQYLPEDMESNVMVSLSALQTAMEDAEKDSSYVGTLTWQIFWSIGWDGLAEVATGDLRALAEECGGVARRFTQAGYDQCLSDFAELQQ